MNQGVPFGQVFEVPASEPISPQLVRARNAFHQIGWHHVLDVLLEEAGASGGPTSNPNRLRHYIFMYTVPLGKRELVEDGEGFRIFVGNEQKFVEFRKEKDELIVTSTYPTQRFRTSVSLAGYAKELFTVVVDYLLSQ